jgi:hypothetical protein
MKRVRTGEPALRAVFCAGVEMKNRFKERIRSFLTSLLKKLSSKRRIERMHLAVCTPCQYDCVSCSHETMRYRFRRYHLPLADLREFIRLTEASRYIIQKIHLTGPGEPLLWKHLKTGLEFLHRSFAFQKVHITSNGLHLDKIDDETWQYIDRMHLSLYPAFKKEAQLEAVCERYGDKIKVNRVNRFFAYPEKGRTAPIPCTCDCTGPMYFDRKIFFYCGPTAFGAAESKGVDVYDYPEMYAEIGLNYLERSDAPLVHRLSRFSITGLLDREAKSADHELCRYCFANKNFALKSKSHDHRAFQH